MEEDLPHLGTWIFVGSIIQLKLILAKYKWFSVKNKILSW